MIKSDRYVDFVSTIQFKRTLWLHIERVQLYIYNKHPVHWHTMCMKQVHIMYIYLKLRMDKLELCHVFWRYWRNFQDFPFESKGLHTKFIHFFIWGNFTYNLTWFSNPVVLADIYASTRIMITSPGSTMLSYEFRMFCPNSTMMLYEKNNTIFFVVESLMLWSYRIFCDYDVRWSVLSITNW